MNFGFPASDSDQKRCGLSHDRRCEHAPSLKLWLCLLTLIACVGPGNDQTLHAAEAQVSPAEVLQKPDILTAANAEANAALKSRTHSSASSAESLSAESLIHRDAIRQTVGVLASDALEGRQAGSRGGQAAAAFLVTELKKTALEPAGTYQWYQEFGNNCRNILAKKTGSDPALREEVILLGAHFDHVGYGNVNNSRGGVGQIHNGADDNASGTSLLLSMARALDAHPPLRRTVIIAFWDSEENGLIGSTHWMNSGLVRTDRIRAVINTDMVGRLRNDTIKVQGWRSMAGFREILARANQSSKLRIKFDDTVNSDSDHWPFYSRRIPALQVDTELHEDYHRPTDDADRIDFEGIERISRWIFREVLTLGNQDTIPAFRNEVFQESQRGIQYVTPLAATPPRLGLTWKNELAEEGEILIDHVRPGSPAGLAGIEVGERMISFGPFTELNTPRLKSLVVTAPPVVPVILRKPDGTQRQVNVHLAGSAIRVGVATRSDPAMPHVVGVTDVIPFSPAATAGLVPGDWIYTVGRQPVGSIQKWRQTADHMTEPTELEVENMGQLRKVIVTPILFSGSSGS